MRAVGRVPLPREEALHQPRRGLEGLAVCGERQADGVDADDEQCVELQLVPARDEVGVRGGASEASEALEETSKDSSVVFSRSAS